MALISGPLPIHEIREAGVAADVGLGVTTVWLRGDHDLSTSAELAAVIRSVVDRDSGDVVIDLSAVSFMDAGTVGHIVGATNRLGAQARNVAVERPSESARRTLGLCGLLGLTGVTCARDLAGSDP